MEDKKFEIALSLLQGIGFHRAKALVSYIGSAEAVFREKPHVLSKIDGIGPHTLKVFNRESALERADLELEYISKHNIKPIYYLDEDYPKKLKNCDDSPIILYTKGNLDFNRKNIAIVGTRKATPYGKQMVNEFIKDIAFLKPQIISGLAYGIDIEAHHSALKNNLSTVGVFAHGLDIIYPLDHSAIAHQMLETGGWVTEFLFQTKMDPAYFPKRNRIVAGICDVTVVVESAEKGGSLITAGLANDYNRDVFAFPGCADRPYSKGCNYLIQKNRAHLITCAQDLIDIMEWDTDKAKKDIQTNIFIELTEEENKIFTILKENGLIEIDNLSHLSNQTMSSLSVHLFNLEMKGAIRALPGKKYEVI